MGNMRFKVGDRVRIKSLDWYNKNKDNYGAIYAGSGFCFWKNMARHCGEIMKITIVKIDPEDSNKGYYFMENSEERWTDEMIEGLAEEEIKPEPKFKVGDRVITTKGYIGKFEGWVSDYQVRVFFEESGDNVVIHPKNLKLVEEENIHNKWNGLKVELELSKSIVGVSNIESIKGERFMSGFVKAIIPPEGYIFKDENGNVINATKIVLEKKKKEYPKTYEKCCEVLGYEDIATHCILHTVTNERLFDSLYSLKICRDAYWKIAGEEMGLDKPWEPTKDDSVFSIDRMHGKIVTECHLGDCCIFEFPTAKMRDAFKENFDPDIEICKEFL